MVSTCSVFETREKVIKDSLFPNSRLYQHVVFTNALYNPTLMVKLKKKFPLFIIMDVKSNVVLTIF